VPAAIIAVAPGGVAAAAFASVFHGCAALPSALSEPFVAT
jgi:hypothetical protein